MSRDHPSAVLKATTRTGLLNRQPSSRLVITVSKSVSSTSISLQARPIGPKSSSTKQVLRSMPGTIDGDGGIRNSNRVTYLIGSKRKLGWKVPCASEGAPQTKADDVGDSAVAIVLDLVKPIGTGGDFGAARWDARLVLQLAQHGCLNRIEPGLLPVKPALVAGSLSAIAWRRLPQEPAFRPYLPC